MESLIVEIVEQHAEEAAFLWLKRDRAARAPHYDLDELCELDERLEAQLDGLRVAGELGWQAACEQLDWKEPGEVFAAAVIAFERGVLEDIAVVLDGTGGDPALTAAFAKALGWAEPETLDAILPGLLSDAVPAVLAQIGIEACIEHRRDPGAWLERALRGDHPGLRASALRAVGVLGRVDLGAELRAHYAADAEDCRLWAAWSGARLGDQAALGPLWAFAEGAGPRAEDACCLALGRLASGEASERFDGLRVHQDRARLAVFAAGVLGDRARLAWLIEQMRRPELARFGGEAFTTITGEAIAGPLEGRPPEGFESGPTDEPAALDVAPDPDDSRRWPNVAAVTAWWAEHQASYAPHVRYLLGQPITADGLRRALRRASQRLRGRVALELALRAPTEPLFAVEAPGARQKRLLGG